MRLQHWVKNLLLFFPILFAGQIQDSVLFLTVAMGFLAFSLIASAMYCINDISDVAQDREHPLKRLRPIASGAVSIRSATIFSGILMISGLGLAAWLNATFLALVLTYAILNALYNIRLKHIAITDVTVIALGFVIRIFCGGVLTTTPISHWLVLMTFLLALLLALGKRRHDLREEMKYALTGAASGYTQAYIDTTITLLGSVTAVAYIFYTISPDVTSRIGSDLVYLTCFPVMLGLMRYLQVLIVFEKPADPVDLFVHDHFLKVLVLTWLIIFVILIYH